MAELENSKDLISVLWSGADILRSKMDANEYKDYLLGKSNVKSNNISKGKDELIDSKLKEILSVDGPIWK